MEKVIVVKKYGKSKKALTSVSLSAAGPGMVLKVGENGNPIWVKLSDLESEKYEKYPGMHHEWD